MAQKPDASLQKDWEKKVALFRKRFASREDVFYKRTDPHFRQQNPDTGMTEVVQKKVFSRACSNYGDKEKCLITQQKGNCSGCSNSVNQPLDNTWVGYHIYGKEQLAIICLKPEGLIKFGAIDFDKSDKEGMSAVFDDAKLCMDYARSMGVKCYIARSTSKGFHLYFFFDQFLEAHLFLSLASHLFLKTGMAARYHAAGITLPEVFPKQVRIGDNAIGNGICPPMIEPEMRRGRKCWMRDDGGAIPFDQQWAYLESTEENLAEEFLPLLEKHEVKIFHQPVNRGKTGFERQLNSSTNGESTDDPITRAGSFWGIVAGCPAMREYWAKDEQGRYKWDISNPKGLFNAARVASMNLAMSTVDGESIILERWNTPQTARQLELASSKNYRPTTCRWMQDNGVCHVKKHPKLEDHCLKKTPPTDKVNGKIVVLHDVPEEMWQEPSPYRFAFDKNLTADDIIEQLGMLFKAMKSEGEPKDPNVPQALDAKGHPIVEQEFRPSNPEEYRNALLKRASKLEGSERDRVYAAIQANKWMNKKDAKTIEKQLQKEESDAAAERRKQGNLHYIDNGDTVIRQDNTIVVQRIDTKGIAHVKQIANFWLELTEEHATILVEDKGEITKEPQITDRRYVGYIHMEGQKIPFNIPLQEWSSDVKLMSQIMCYAGSGVIIRKADIETIRNSAGHFSEHKVVKRSLRDIGLFKFPNAAKFIMPSIVINKDGIHPNNEYMISLKGDTVKYLDFKVLDDSEFKDVARHIIQDLFSVANRKTMMTAFAHVMAATLVDRLKDAVQYQKAPVLWLAGSHGQGKSWVAETMQYFFGDFSKSSAINAQGSSTGQFAVLTHFRHVAALIDDVKFNGDPYKYKQMIKLIQSSYDRTIKAAANRDGSAREENARLRGLIMITGEDIPKNEASAISRLILLEDRIELNNQVMDSVSSMRKHYMGFTPHVIHFWMNCSNEDIAKLWHQYKEKFVGKDPTKSEKNSNIYRVAENLSLNMVGFEITMMAMESKGAISSMERQKLVDEHFKNLSLLKYTIVEEVAANRGSIVFLESLKEALQNPNKYIIGGLPATEGLDYTRNATVIGVYQKKTPETVYLFPKLAYEAAKSVSNKANLEMQTLDHVGRQLEEDDHLDKEKVTRHRTKSIRGPVGPVNAWPVKSASLGLNEIEIAASTRTAQENAKQQTNQHKPSMDEPSFEL